MSAHQDTAQQLRKVANFLKGIVSAADALDALGSIEQAQSEAVAAQEKAALARDATLLELADVQARVKESAELAASSAAATLEDATNRAAALLADAEERSQANARSVVNQAIADAGDIRAKASAAMDKANYELDATMRRRAEVLIELTDLESVLVSLRSEHDALAAGIANMKARFA